MELTDFLRVIIGLAVGFLVTGSIFVIGHVFIDDVLSELKPDIFIITMSTMIWLVVSFVILVGVYK